VLHRTIKDSENVTVQATNSPEEELPKFRLPQGQSSASVAYQLTEDELMLEQKKKNKESTKKRKRKKKKGNKKKKK
jgi:carbonic anhydrase/acetyltransferase-like protein (isoleucine patch superfamily)